MRIQSICVVLLSVLLCPFASAQVAQTNGLRDRQIAPRPVVGTNDSQETSRELLGLPTQHPLRKISFPQSKIYIIDTAVVRATWDTTRHLYSYDVNAKRTSDLTQKLNGDLWVDSLLETNTYDASNNMLTDLNEVWSNGQWVNFFRNTYTYDANGHRLFELEQDWSTGQWVKSWRNTYTYDTSWGLTTLLRENWSNGQWVNAWRDTSTYDINGNQTSFGLQVWSNNEWVNSWRARYTYNANGRTQVESDEQWAFSQWANWWRTTYTYDATGNLTTYLVDQWDISQWRNYFRYSYTYDANWEPTSLVCEDGWTGQWVNDERYTYTYDAYRNLMSVWHYNWNWLDSSWTPTDIPNFVGYLFTITDSAGNEYSYYGYNLTFARKFIVTGVASKNGNVPAVYTLSQNYPNPFNPSTTIRFGLPKAAQVTLSVYDILGREVSVLVNDRRDAGVHEVKFDGSHLASGVYFYRLQAGDFVQTKKLLLLR